MLKHFKEIQKKRSVYFFLFFFLNSKGIHLAATPVIAFYLKQIRLFPSRNKYSLKQKRKSRTCWSCVASEGWWDHKNAIQRFIHLIALLSLLCKVTSPLRWIWKKKFWHVRRVWYSMKILPDVIWWLLVVANVQWSKTEIKQWLGDHKYKIPIL